MHDDEAPPPPPPPPTLSPHMTKGRKKSHSRLSADALTANKGGVQSKKAKMNDGSEERSSLFLKEKSDEQNKSFKKCLRLERRSMLSENYKCYVRISNEREVELKWVCNSNFHLRSNRILDEEIVNNFLSFTKSRKPKETPPHIILRRDQNKTLAFPLGLIDDDGKSLEFTPTHWYRKRHNKGEKKQKKKGIPEDFTDLKDPIQIASYFQYKPYPKFIVKFEYVDDFRALTEKRLIDFFTGFIAGEYEDGRSQLIRLSTAHFH